MAETLPLSSPRRSRYPQFADSHEGLRRRLRAHALVVVLFTIARSSAAGGLESCPGGSSARSSGRKPADEPPARLAQQREGDDAIAPRRPVVPRRPSRQTAAGMAMIAAAPGSARSPGAAAVATEPAWSSLPRRQRGSAGKPEATSPSGSATPSPTRRTARRHPDHDAEHLAEHDPKPDADAQPPTKPKPKPAHGQARHRRAATVVDRAADVQPGQEQGLRAAQRVTVSQERTWSTRCSQVSWRGFTPSSSVTYEDTQTDYPVMIVECKGTNPKSPERLLWRHERRRARRVRRVRAMNTSYSTTRLTVPARRTSCCSPTWRTSSSAAADHPLLARDRAEPGRRQPGLAAEMRQPQAGRRAERHGPVRVHREQTDFPGACSWNKRIVVPMSFAPTPSGCPLHNPNHRQRLADARQPRCPPGRSGSARRSPVKVQYDGSLNETEARSYFQSGIDDVAFTTPGRVERGGPDLHLRPGRDRGRAGYWVDNPSTGKPFTHIKLDARLLVKLLTSPTIRVESCGNGTVPKGVGCDNAVDKNPNTVRRPGVQEAQPARCERRLTASRSRPCCPASAT